MRNSGDQTVNSTTITTEGDNAHGIDLSGARGTVKVTSGSITAEGSGVRGITVGHTPEGGDVQGPVTIDSTTISAEGYESRGIYVDAVGGVANPIVVNGGNITVAGQYSQGIQISTNVATDVKVTGSVTATGEETIGVQVDNEGHTELDMGVVSVNGVQSTGIGVYATPGGSLAPVAGSDVELHADSVRVLGNESTGVEVQAETVEIDLDDLQVSGDDSRGVAFRGSARTADVTIRNANITGSGSSLTSLSADEKLTVDLGMIRFGENANPNVVLSSIDVEATVRDMVSTSATAGGLTIEATDEATLNIGRLSTAGGSSSPSAAATITAGGNIVVKGLDNPDGTLGGSISTTGAGARGLDLRSETGTITATLASISTAGPEASAIRVRTGEEDGSATDDLVTLDIGAITTQGRRSHGVDVVAQNANITVGSVSAKAGSDGQSGTGIKVLTEGQGVVTVRAGSVSTEGNDAYGIHVEGNPEADTPAETTVTVVADSVTTAGDGATGVVVKGRVANVTVGDVETTNNRARGLEVTGTDSASVTVLREVTTKGVGATAINVTTMDENDVLRGAVTVNAAGARVSTEGNGATALRAQGTNVTVTGGSYSTAGALATAIDVTATDDVSLTGLGSVSATGGGSAAVVVDTAGDITLAATSVEATGAGTTEGYSAIDLTSTEGAITVNVGSVRTTGDRTDGIVASTAGDVSVAAGDITTSGAGSVGVRVEDGGGDVSVAVRSVTSNGNAVLVSTAGDITIDRVSNPDGTAGGVISTTGDNARGLDLRSVSGGIDVEAASVTTAGADAAAVYARTGAEGAEATDALVQLNVGTVTTTGDQSNGFDVVAGNVDIAAGTVTTSGARSTGVKVRTQGPGATTVRATTVTTQGQASHGIAIARDEGDTSETVATVVAGTVTTAGVEASGIVVEAGSADVVVNSVTTTGARAGGVRVTADTTARVRSAGTISTTGDHANGVEAIATADGGAAEVFLAHISTAGLMSHGVAASGDSVVVSFTTDRAAASTITTTGRMSEAVTVFDAGDASLSLGVLRAEGEGSRGVVVDATGEVFLQATSVNTTAGVYSAQSPDAIVLTSSGGDVTALVGAVGTVGHGARGVTAVASEGDVHIEVGEIQTAGEAAHGVDATASGNIEIRSNRIATTGAGSIGITADSGQEMEINVGEIAGLTTLIEASSGEDMTVTLGQARSTGAAAAVIADSEGDVTMAVTRELSSTGGAAAEVHALGFIDFTVAQNATVRGGEAGLRLDSGLGTHLINGGAISAANGPALDIKGGAATIDNAGGITGRIDLTADNDVLNNAGRFTASGNSDFGAGTDVSNNTGLIELADVAGARSVSFLNLERLNNAGTIDLSNGRAGDVFTISGVMNGQTGNSVLMDLDLRTDTPAADRIVAGGFEGVTRVLLDVAGRGRIGETGVLIAQSNRAQTGAEVVVDVANGGFVDYSVLLSGNAFMLQGSLATPAFEPTKIASGAQHQWTSGADVVSARFEQMHDGGLGEGKGVQIWSQAFDGSADIDAWRTFDVEGETIGADLTHEVKSRGLQAGVDKTFGDITVGLLAGTGRTELRFRNGDRTRFDGQGLGAYGHWGQGPFSLGAVLKFDDFDVAYDWAEADLRTRADGSTLGLRVDVSWRANIGDSWYLEPQGSMSWSDTSLDSIESDTGRVDFGNTRSMVGRVGIRAGGQMTVGDGMAMRPYASLHVLNEFKGDNASRLHLDSQSILIDDEANDAWARGTMGVSVGGSTGLGGFLQAEQDFGAVEGFTARAGVRYAW